MSRLRLSICSPQLGLSPTSNLGGEVFDREILLGLAKRGVTVEAILPSHKPIGVVPKNLRVTRIILTHFPALLFNILIISPLFKINKRDKITIIRLHQPQFMALGAIFFKLFRKKTKIIATYHQFRETNFLFMSKVVNNVWDHIICDSENVKSKITSQFGVLPQKITVVHNGVPSYLKPSKKDDKLLKKLNLKDKKVILFMGFFIDRKNPLFLLDVLEKLKKEIPEIVIIFWGEGPLKDEIIKKAQLLALTQNIRILPPLYGSPKNLIHNLADIFVLPSLDEGFALAPLEAMACAKPVIMNQSHSASEAIMDGENGYLCKTSNSKDWAEHIINFLKDKKMLARMGENSRKRAEKEFRWEIAINKHLDIIKKLSPKQ